MPAKPSRTTVGRAARAALLGMSIAGTPSAAVMIEQVEYEGWKQAFRISNEEAELVVVPEIARIMHYSFKGGPNVLWVNPALKGKTGSPEEWLNFGGDKVWIWPQSGWKSKWGNWPPPYECDSAPHRASRIPGSGVAMTSPVVAGFGVRIYREIRLAPSGTGVEILTALKPDGKGVEFPVAAWSITQLPPPGLLLARLHASSPGKPWKDMNDTRWDSIRREGNRFLRLEPPEKPAKAGMDADLLAWADDLVLFTQTLRLRRGSPRRGYQPGDMAQVFSSASEKREDAYVEFEFTSPRARSIECRDAELAVVWELRRLPEGTSVATAVLGILGAK